MELSKQLFIYTTTWTRTPTIHVQDNNFFFKRCRDEVPKSKQTRCRDSLSTKLNVHSPIPTSFSHVTATCSTVGHYQYNIILFVG